MRLASQTLDHLSLAIHWYHAQEGTLPPASNAFSYSAWIKTPDDLWTFWSTLCLHLDSATMIIQFTSNHIQSQSPPGMTGSRSDITPDPGGHRPQGRGGKQDQVQASALGQNRTQFVGGATTHGRRTRQAGNSVPT